MRICILTHALKTNYGGLLQAFALQKVLRDMGHNVVTAKESASQPLNLIERVLYFVRHLITRYIFRNKIYNPFRYFLSKFNPEPHFFDLVSVNTNRFIEQYIQTVDFFENGCSAPKKEVLDKFDALVVGSDQVWRPFYVYTPSYFLDFSANTDIIRVAYAASFGIDTIDEYTPQILNKCVKGAKLFDAISVREDSGVAICREYFGVDAVNLLDPTMLLDKEVYLRVIEEPDRCDDVLVCYILDKTPKKIEIINHIASKLHLKILSLGPEKAYIEGDRDISNRIYPSVSKWLAGFRDAKFVITDSFHGTVFSIIFNKPFISVNNNMRGASRFISLLKIFNLESRLVDINDKITNEMFEEIDYNKVNNIIAECRKKSFDFLNKNLKNN